MHGTAAIGPTQSARWVAYVPHAGWLLACRPEAGLAGAAGVIGTLAGTRLRRFKIQADMRQRLLVLASMGAGFGSFLPNPLTAVLLVMELANPVIALGMTYMHAVVALGAACTAGFAAYYAIAGAPYMKPMTVALTTSYLKFSEMQLVEVSCPLQGNCTTAWCSYSPALLPSAPAALLSCLVLLQPCPAAWHSLCNAQSPSKRRPVRQGWHEVLALAAVGNSFWRHGRCAGAGLHRYSWHR